VERIGPGFKAECFDFPLGHGTAALISAYSAIGAAKIEWGYTGTGSNAFRRAKDRQRVNKEIGGNFSAWQAIPKNQKKEGGVAAAS